MRTTSWSGVLASAAVALLVLAGCGHDTPRASDDLSPTPTATVAEPASTTSAPVPAAGAIPFITSPSGDTVTTGPEGSGCSPSSAIELPDGLWFGWVRSVDPVGSTMGLDLACLYFGDAANAAAAAAGVTEIPVPDGTWIGDVSKNVYTLRLVPDVTVGVVPESFSNGENLVPGGSGAAALTPTLGRGVWVEVTDGWVVAVQQQYLP